jgi:hypothetical protein
MSDKIYSDHYIESKLLNTDLGYDYFKRAYTLEMPKYSDWHVEMFPGTHVKVLDKKLPNRFQRWMQELVFGFKWRKDGKL